MSKSEDQKREDEVLLRMLKTPPKPHADMKGKPSRPSKDALKAQAKLDKGAKR